MKNAIFLIVTLLCFSVQFASSQTPEEKKLIDVIRLETESFRKGDTTTWKTLFVHDDKLSLGYTMNGYTINLMGWESILKDMALRISYRTGPSKYTILKQHNYNIRLSDQMASMIYDQEVAAPAKDSLPSGFTREFRTLVKEDGKWKITSLQTLDTLSFTSTKPVYVENVLNAMGYSFVNEKKWDQAIAIFKFNVSMFPKAWNTYDSLGEAYAKSGNKALAIENYNKSVELNPKNDNGIKVLKELKNP
ncbi:tetratricopeptide repeat protein [Pedobacter mucosus]|uniref:tetratricopeptide repeat protein n=1 Tax=Pedobacter mucosus TaxID=2895286 RepID=UPI001EE4DBA2|nr:tetratricopeptide repeat protein [Pedobacter mucosus]UKT64516.1 tetratricopeptide repeat protein [Pedobacter mucosus]